jgi:flagellin-like hook-associated protein FlgL
MTNMEFFVAEITAKDVGTAYKTDWTTDCLSGVTIANSRGLEGTYITADTTGTYKSVNGVDPSDDEVMMFGLSFTLNDGDGGAEIATFLNGYHSGYTFSYANNKITARKDVAGPDTANYAAFSSNSTDKTAGGTFLVGNTTAKDGRLGQTPTVTTGGWTNTSGNEWTDGTVTIKLNATTPAGTITITAPYEEKKMVASPGTVTNAEDISLQVGARTKDLKTYNFDYSSVWETEELKEKAVGELKADINVTASGLGLVPDEINLSTQNTANIAIDNIDFAINKVSMIRATFGSIQNRLEHKIDNLNVTGENLTAAESRIRDTNIAEETMELAKAQILSQASQSMLAQANQLPQNVLSLLQ